MNAYGVARDRLAVLVERAVAVGMRVSRVEFKAREKGTAEVRFFFHCSAVVNTSRNAKQAWLALANRHRIPIKMMDPVQQNATAEEEQVDGLTENDLAEVFAASASVDGTQLAQLAKLVNRYVELETEAEALETQAGERSRELNKLRAYDIPEIMRKARILTQDMDSGHRVSLGTAIAGGWPKDEVKRAAALKALSKLNSADLVKQTVTITFAPDEHAVAAQVIAYLKRKKVHADVDRTINTMTYRAWAKEMLNDQKTAPVLLSLLNELGLLVMDQATVKQIKSRKR